jgi:hypothetical protein
MGQQVPDSQPFIKVNAGSYVIEELGRIVKGQEVQIISLNHVLDAEHKAAGELGTGLT